MVQTATKKLSHNYETATDLGDGLHRFTCSVCQVTKNDRHNFAQDANTCTECGAEKEHVFDGKKYEYVGSPVTEAPTLEGNTFDATKYTAKVDDVKWDNVGGNNQALYTAYDDNMLYIAVELDKSAYDAMTALALKIITSDGATYETAVTALQGDNYRVYVDEANGKVTVALNASRSALAFVDTASTGNSSDNAYLVLVTLDGEVKELLIITDEEGTSNVTLEGEGDTSIDILGTYVVIDADKVISVSLKWESVTFTYTAEFEWSDSESGYVLKEDSGKWSTEPMTITVTNRSNQVIEAGFSFAATVSGVTGKFTAEAVTDGDDANGEVDMAEIIAADGINTIEFESAESGVPGVQGSAKSATVCFYITGGELTEAQAAGAQIGNITITIRAK